MATFNVNVKWGKKKIPVELNTAEPPEVFKAQLFALTGVEPSRQKVLIAGKTVKDGDSWSSFKVKNNALFMLMGSADEAIQAPQEKTRFVEDMDEHEIAGASQLPLGLQNFGNTCYMNSTLQCLRSVPELKTALALYAARPGSSLTRSLATLFHSLDKYQNVETSTLGFLMALRQANDQFAQQTNGHYAQQDAGECFGEVIQHMQQELPPLGADNGLDGEAHFGRSFVDQYLNIRTTSTMSCIEAPEEPPSTSSDTFWQLRCHIEKDVGYLMAGLKLGLVGDLEKTSDTLGRLAVYKKESAISRLPAYLVINFVRFYFKRSTATKCKVTKPVKFSLDLDVYDLCSPELKEKMKPHRDLHMFYNELQAEKALEGKLSDKKEGDSDEMEVDQEYEPWSFEDDPGSSNTGFYELVGVLTHMGRSSDSGHYVAWVRQKKGEWLLFDDDKVSPQTDDDVLKLCGGGADWHMAYYLIYAPKKLPKLSDEDREIIRAKAGSKAAGATPPAEDVAATSQ